MKKRVFDMITVGLTAALSLGIAVTAFAGARLPEGLTVGDIRLSGLTLEEARQEILNTVESMAGQKVTLKIQGETVGTTAGELGFFWSNEAQLEEAAERYENSSLVGRYLMTEDLAREPEAIPLETSVKEELVEAFVTEHCEGLGEAPQDAFLVREDGEFRITPEVIGTEIDLEATTNALNEALKGDLQQEVLVTAVIKDSHPKITAEDLKTIQDVLGTFSTDFSSSGAARSTNLTVGAEKLNGHVLMPGETLSGYEYLHPFTEENGYKTAAAYENGQVVDSVGGGVCQIATTLYNAALFAELEITQRQNHSMVVGYVKPSQDAAIAGTYKDIKITNNQDTPIYVEGYTKGKTLTFTIYGKETRPANRELRFESETLSVTDPGAPTEVLNSSLAPGTRKQVQSAHKGLKSQLWKIVLVDGKETERTLLSTDTYRASPAVVQVGPAVPASVPQPEAEQPAVEELPGQAAPLTEAASEQSAGMPPEESDALPGVPEGSAAADPTPETAAPAAEAVPVQPPEGPGAGSDPEGPGA